MSIVKMKHLRLMAMQQDREELLHRLQRMGCVEIDEPSADWADPEWAGLKAPDGGQLTRARELRGESERALAALKRYAPEKGGLLKARPVLTEGELFDPVRLERAEQAVRTVLDTERRLAALRAEQTKLEARRQALAPWLELDVPLDTGSTRDLVVALGTLPASVVLSEAEGQLRAQSELIHLQHVSSDGESHYLLLVCHASAAEQADQTLKSLGWTHAPMRGWTGTALDNDRSLARQLEELSRQAQQAEQSLRASGELRREICHAADWAAVEIGRGEGRGRLLDTQSAFLLEGWVPQDSWQPVEQLLAGYLCAWEMRDPAPEEYPQVPVQLKNNLLTRCMNVVTEMYSLPAYDGVDPNPLMFPFFVLFFGIMMADMAYGLLMIVGALFVLRKTSPREGTRNFMEGVLWCGVSTFVVGAMTGGFFGDFIPQIAKVIDPSSNVQLPALFTPLDDTVAIMLGSLVLGAIQVFTGMTVSIVKKTSEGNFIDALFDEITWWIILGGGALAIFGVGTVSGVPVVLVIGILMLVFGGTREAKGFGKVTKLVGLVYNGVTGFFSDILSYVRLMALMLSGSVIAQVFNTLAATFGNVVLFVIISMIGNALNLALNLLGCYVHDLRLQCLEFFNRFYREGGRPYAPLSYQTKYADIIKEDN